MKSKGTLVILRRDGEVLMARKTRGDNAGCLNFPGGHMGEEDGGDTKLCAARECLAEVGYRVLPDDLVLFGKLRFYFGGVFKWEVEVFVANCFFEAIEEIDADEDMADPVWLSSAEIPYDKMWPGDREWLPRVLLGEKADADIYYSADHSAVEKIEWQEARF